MLVPSATFQKFYVQQQNTCTLEWRQFVLPLALIKLNQIFYILYTFNYHRCLNDYHVRPLLIVFCKYWSPYRCYVPHPPVPCYWINSSNIRQLFDITIPPAVFSIRTWWKRIKHWQDSRQSFRTLLPEIRIVHSQYIESQWNWLNFTWKPSSGYFIRLRSMETFDRKSIIISWLRWSSALH